MQFAVKTLLHEGGPTLFGQFLAAEAVDELFLTLSPQIAGREGDPIRPAIVQGVEFSPDSARWFQMISAKQRDAYYICAIASPEPKPFRSDSLGGTNFAARSVSLLMIHLEDDLAGLVWCARKHELRLTRL